MTKSDSVWSIKELVALADEVNTVELEYREKVFNLKFCELTEEEEPKMVPLDDNASEDDQADWYRKVGSEKILAMIKKAYTKEPEGECLDEKTWSLLPSTLRYKIIAEVIRPEGALNENFPIG